MTDLEKLTKEIRALMFENTLNGDEMARKIAEYVLGCNYKRFGKDKKEEEDME